MRSADNSGRELCHSGITYCHIWVHEPCGGKNKKFSIFPCTEKFKHYNYPMRKLIKVPSRITLWDVWVQAVGAAEKETGLTIAIRVGNPNKPVSMKNWAVIVYVAASAAYEGGITWCLSNIMGSLHRNIALVAGFERSNTLVHTDSDEALFWIPNTLMVPESYVFDLAGLLKARKKWRRVRYAA